jgi:hypothetical protein
MGQSHAGDVGITGLRDGDGKFASGIARDSVLQIDDNVLDHRNAPERA